ncbi:trans-1,2-dihydrobenzene-1,2-diol dehydrogenase-like [Branchiostoma lanceolatum]|uniref:trans-1,2-dihydrobenzene-1,2-diol dehydrogenase-like n=1 Tax=Branchiostoma lanceolatum TaxID=7740 RepID=UPI003455A5DB
MAPTRWGIVSAGKISNDFKVALDTLSEDEHQVVAVAARSLERAEQFAKTHSIPSAYGSYAELAAQKDIDVVYIGATHPQHASVTTMMLRAGMPVLCEKPKSVSSREVRQMTSLAEKNNLFFMEAIWSRFFPVYEKVREILDSGELGEVKMVTASFGINFDSVQRFRDRSLTEGSLVEVGIYPIQFTTMAFGGEEPQDVTATGQLIDTGVDEAATIVLKYSNNRMAVLTCSMSTTLSQEAHVYGTKTSFKIPNFWCPTEVITPDRSHSFPLPRPEKPLNYFNSTGLRFEAMEVRRCLQDGLSESPLLTHAMSLQIARILDRARRAVGVHRSRAYCKMM